MHLAMLLVLMHTHRPITRSQHPIKAPAVIEIPELTAWRKDVSGRCFEVNLDDQALVDHTIPCKPPKKKKA